ncbi:MAG TPA: glycine cleavage system aminomethyltransferase GcvT [Pseudolabrys sp.]|nr:glycine cleavage system aminomethyltransferase GcvT [Pseudolabrys sp.]
MSTLPTALKRTPLHALHLEQNARMVAFAGYDMPVHYALGVLKEHLHVRAAAGLFDVSHMGQFAICPAQGGIEGTARALESLVPADVVGLRAGRQRYALLTNDEGGIRDDLMIANMGDRLVIIVNAACKDADEAYLRQALPPLCKVERLDDRALLALQGPAAEAVLAQLAPDVAAMRFMDVRSVKLLDQDCVISRSGYTGEDGFEMSVPAGAVEALARKLLSDTRVALIGLGARDTLRLEAGLCLYGSDLDPSTTPVEAALEWSIPASRRRGGSRAGGFPGADIIFGQLESAAPRRRIGLRPDGRAPIRHGAALFDAPESTNSIGAVTSGGFGPSVGGPVAMGYVPASAAASAAPIWADLRGERVPVRLAKLPFVTPTYKR